MPVLPPLQMLFTDHDVRGLIPHPLDGDSIWRIGFSASTYLRSVLAGYDRSDPNVNRLIIAHDGRPASKILYPSLRNGVLSSDVGVLDLGEADWPQLCYTVLKLKTAGGIMLTAGTLPVGYAGLRMVGQRAKPITKETGLHEVARIAERVLAHGKPPMQQASPFSILKDYRTAVRRWGGNQAVTRPVTVVYDSLGGVMTRMLPILLGDYPGMLLLPAGPVVDLGQRSSPPPDTRLAENLSRLTQQVVQQKADMGVAFDGDGQRAVFCDAGGNLLSAQAMLMVLLGVMSHDYPNPTVVVEGTAFAGLADLISRLGGRRIVSQRRGRSYFYKAMQENQAVVGVEASGRFFFQDLQGLESPTAALIGIVRAMMEAQRPLKELVVET